MFPAENAAETPPGESTQPQISMKVQVGHRITKTVSSPSVFNSKCFTYGDCAICYREIQIIVLVLYNFLVFIPIDRPHNFTLLNVLVKYAGDKA